MCDASKYTPCLSDFSVAETLCAEARELGGDLGVVVSLDRSLPAVASDVGVFRAELATAFAHAGSLQQPTVGDFVAVLTDETHDAGRILGLCERRNVVFRGRAALAQPLAANVDCVAYVQAVDTFGEACLERIAKASVIVRDAGARFVVVLSKCDTVLPKKSEDSVGELRRIFEDVPVFCVRADKVDASFAKRLVPKKSTCMLLGESGAGKSTLTNALVGAEVFEVGAVQKKTGKGRHTTVARRMVCVPGGGVLIDCPGIRMFDVAGKRLGLERSFPAILHASQMCQFRDCTHTHEPGCAVVEAEAAGELDAQALFLYRSLAKAVDKDV